VWLLDSDCVVLRPDALSAQCAVMDDTGAALVGQRGYDTSDAEDLLGLHSLLIDPSQVWQPTIAPFQDHGSPSEALQRSCALAELLAVDFPYTRGGYILPIGGGSLREIVATGDRTNRHYEWATTHNEPHFALEVDAPAAYAAFQAAFARDVPTPGCGQPDPGLPVMCGPGTRDSPSARDDASEALDEHSDGLGQG
jgi:hypothetical protein